MGELREREDEVERPLPTLFSSFLHIWLQLGEERR